MHTIKTLVVLLISVQVILANENPLQEFYIVSGIMSDGQTGDPIPFGTLSVQGSALGVTSDIDGSFRLVVKDKGAYRLVFSCLGYQAVDTMVLIEQDTGLQIRLQPKSFALNEVVVTARENTKNNTSSEIGREAMQHIQPSSFADLLQLLPGQITRKVDMGKASYMNLRQAGNDVNTSLGTLFVIDGMPLGNDAVQNVYGKKDPDGSIGRTTRSDGIDLRTISTDRIEKVEIVRGIPSVEYGDLTSGLVKIDLKSGRTPWEGRIKTDFNNKLFSLGKGFILPGEGGTLNLDADYVQYLVDPRSKLSTYTRSTFSGRHRKYFSFTDHAGFELKSTLSYTGSFDKAKSDPDLMKGKDDYEKNAYNNISISSAGTFKLLKSFVHEFGYQASADYTKTKLDIRKLITPGVMPLPSATASGEYEALYLPAQYTSYLTVDGQPLNLFAKVTAKAGPRTGNFRHKLLSGAEWLYQANLGDGELYDAARPPYPGGKSTRPRPYRDIPAMQKISLYLEDDVRYPAGKWLFSAVAGIRAGTMPGLSDRYSMSGRWYAEPRINLKIDLPQFTAGDRSLKVGFNGGFGQHYKYPTQAQLYPAPLYFDYVQLNYYSQQESLRMLHVKTFKEDPVNDDLVPALNTKYEAGIILQLDKVRLSVTYFNEQMDNGFTSENTLLLHHYNKYDPNSVDPGTITTKPELSQFAPPVADTASALYYKARNGALVHKQGVEYTLSLGKIQSIYTNIQVNGAWFKTIYRYNGLRYYHPANIINQKPYPYVGVYDWNNENQVKQQFNTNLHLDTHIPSLRLVFSTDLQFMWFEETGNFWNNGLPSGYIDHAGEYHVFDPGRKDETMMKYLVTDYSLRYFDPDTKPVAIYLNFKATKEIGNKLVVSFYVNSLLNYLPDYTSKNGQRMTRRVAPRFGAELIVKL